jgi:hypothetical protein
MTPFTLAAPADGTSDAAEALQRALEGNEAIRIPAGRYLIGRTLRVPSGRTITAEDGAHFILADGAAPTQDDYLITNADHAGGNQNIHIRGGIWDGNNVGNPRPGPSLTARGYTGAIMHFQNVAGLEVSELEVRNAEAYYIRLTRVNQFTISDISFGADIVRPNNDGIHLGGFCEDGVIRRLRGLRPGVTGDDMVALNADDASERTEVFGMANGPIRRIRVEDVEAEDCHSFVRLLSVWSPIEDVSIRAVRGTCSVAAINADAARNCRVQVFDPAHPPYADGVGLLKNIHATGFRVARSSPGGTPLLRLETRMENFVVEDFERVREWDNSPETPTLRLQNVVLKAFTFNENVQEPLSLDQEFASDADQIELRVS